MPATVTSPGRDEISTDLIVEGMSCANCARHVQEALSAVPGVATATVSLETSRVRVRWQPGNPVELPALAQAVQAAGYSARPADSEIASTESSNWSPLSGWRFNVLAGSIATAALMAGEWFFDWGMERWFQWVAFGLALPVQAIAGARFYRGAWQQIKLGRSNMDTLVALGSTTAFAYSVWAVFSRAPGHVYFMESCAIITLISAGHWLEARASRQAAGSLRRLLELAPARARRQRGDGSIEEVESADLRTGNLVLLRPGERIPVDGRVVLGEGAVDESMLTGESMPVEKISGHALYAGTLNLNGQLQFEVDATGSNTALARIIVAVERAQSSRAGIQRLADSVSNIFVPVVVLVALATALWWGLAGDSARQAHALLAHLLWPTHVPGTALAAAVLHAAAVLIIACPCAMGLATPVAIMAGTGAASERGILIRDGVALEKAGKISAVLFDKTGTLTMGRFSIAAVEEISGEPGQSALLAASLGAHSNHPLSRAMAEQVAGRLDLQGWRETAGGGVSADWSKSGGLPVHVRLGALRWLAGEGVEDATESAFARNWMEAGATVIGLSVGEKMAGLFALRDTVKPGAAATLEKLRRDGFEIFLVTGDNAKTASSIGRELGLPDTHVFAEVNPAGKAALLRRLQEAGQRVAFVGDGINDAPALEAADLGIAVGRASDIAAEAADIVLLNSDLDAVPEALRLARQTLRIIRQNLFWAFFYNAAAVPLAALGFLNPVVSAVAMGLSDIIVIGNALRLRQRKPPVLTENAASRRLMPK